MSGPVTSAAPAAAAPSYALDLRPLDPDADAALVHAWVTAPRARFWQMERATLDEVRAEYLAIAADPRREAWIGLHDGVPAFLVEAYDPADDQIGAHLDPLPGDRGMHLLVAPPVGDPLPGFTTAVMRHVVAHLLRDPAVRRLVVEPDVRNTRIQRLNELVGFRPLRVVDLGAKHALLSVATRDDALLHATPTDGHAMTLTHDRPRDAADPAGVPVTTTTATAEPASEPDPRVHPAAHLRPDVWAAATRHLVRKALAEFAHELLLAPDRVEPVRAPGEPRRPHDPRAWAEYRVEGADGRSAYAYRARVLELDHWDVDEASIRRTVDGEPAELDATDLVLDLRDRLGITDEVLPVYLDEIQSTLSAAAFSRLRDVPDARGLLTASYAEVESTMDEGHPCFVATNGRIGFDLDDHDRYAPEAGQDVRILWLGVHERLARFTAVEGLDREAFLDSELGASARARFRARMRELGIDPAERVLVPVHPWQWENVVTVTFAGLVARRDIVLLGTGDDEYGAQQSIRTWANRTSPERCYVKTSLSILNMGFTRGLSPAYMAVTPAINDWVHALVTGDAEFARLGFGILREVAAVGVRDERVEAALPPGHSHGKMLSALWRESPVPGLDRGRAADEHDEPAARGRARRHRHRRAHRRVRDRRGRVAPPLARRLPRSARARPPRARPRVHAARRERDPRAPRPRRRPRADEGHRRGGRPLRHRARAAGGRAADPDGDPRGRAHPHGLHRRDGRLPPLRRGAPRGPRRPRPRRPVARGRGGARRPRARASGARGALRPASTSSRRRSTARVSTGSSCATTGAWSTCRRP
ncbi:hypothetical protein ABID70_001360 [Clavibacter michiganensis]